VVTIARPTAAAPPSESKFLHTSIANRRSITALCRQDLQANPPTTRASKQLCRGSEACISKPRSIIRTDRKLLLAANHICTRPQYDREERQNNGANNAVPSESQGCFYELSLEPRGKSCWPPLALVAPHWAPSPPPQRGLPAALHKTGVAPKWCDAL